MARIETYVEDSLVTENDVILGSDGDNFNKTKNFKVSALTQFVEAVTTNNVAKIVPVFVSINETLQSKLQSINLTVKREDNPVLINFLKSEEIGNGIGISLRKYTYLFPLGNGTYNPLSDYISMNDLVLVNSGNPTLKDIEGFGNTVTIDLGDITGSNIVDVVNNATPSYDLSNSLMEYFFTYIETGNVYIYKFEGTNGFYGSNDLQSTVHNFLSLNDGNVDYNNTKAKYINVNLSSSYPNEADEIQDVSDYINSLDPSIKIQDKELFIAYSEGDLMNDVSETYKSVYIINTGKGVYGLNDKQISTGNIIKIRGDVINKKLSDYENDTNFTDKTYVDDADDLKVNKSGDTMTGTLDMSNNLIEGVAMPLKDQDAANRYYVDTLKRFKGSFQNSDNLLNLTDNQPGDYATMSNGKVNQLWAYQGSKWILESAKPYVFEATSSIDLSNDFHKSTIDIKTGNISLNMPDDVIEGLEFYIRNYSGGSLNFNTTGTSTSTRTELPTNNLATVIYDGSNYIVDSTGNSFGEDIQFGIYNYQNTKPVIPLVSETYVDLSNNGNGSDSFVSSLPGVPNVYDITTERFDFSNLDIGDLVYIRADLNLDLDVGSEVVDCELVLGERQSGEYNLPLFSSKYYNEKGVYRIVEDTELFIGNELTKDNPAYLRLKILKTGTVDVVGFYIKVTKRG